MDLLRVRRDSKPCLLTLQRSIAAGGFQGGDCIVNICLPLAHLLADKPSLSYAAVALWMVGANKPLKPGEEAGELNRPRPAKWQHSALRCGAAPEVTAVCWFTSPAQCCCAEPMLQ